MTTPVTNDKTPTLTAQQRPAIRDREMAQTAQRPDTPPPEARQAETTREVSEPDIGRASRLFQTENGGVERSAGAIRDGSQASSVLARLKEQFAENPEGALQAMRGAGEHNIQSLLQAPAV